MLHHLRANPQDIHIIGDIWLTLMDQLDFLKYRLEGYVDVLHLFFGQRDWKGDALEKIGEHILEIAEKNASMGYMGTESLTATGVVWQQREEIARELYNAAGFGEPPGLTTGADYLIDSLRRQGNGNIFQVNVDLGSVIVGTKWRHAKLLEEGGFRNVDDQHLGLKFDETGSMIPKQWLIDVLGPDRAEFLAQQLQNILENQDMAPYISARPYLKPALWYSTRDDITGKMLVQIIISYLMRLMSGLPNWSLKDTVNIQSESDLLESINTN